MDRPSEIESRVLPLLFGVLARQANRTVGQATSSLIANLRAAMGADLDAAASRADADALAALRKLGL